MAGDSLFDVGVSDALARTGPLAARMRPRSIAELVGHRRLTEPGGPLDRLVRGDRPVSVLLWGPPGSGKTTIAQLLAAMPGRRFVELSAVTAGIKDVRDAIDGAKDRLGAGGERTVLFVDEVHRFSKTQQDALLPGVERGYVTLVAATTENPSFSVVSPLLSRLLLLRLEPLTDDDVASVLRRAISDERGLGGRVSVTDEAIDFLVRLAQGDARRALTVLEAAASGEQVDVADVERANDAPMVRYDRTGDQHYDVISAFIKSIRGGDVDAALHYLARMLEAGEDPRFISRRLMILASEDIGLADPTALTLAVAGAQAVERVGLPEGQLTLAHVTIHLALAPKSNAVTSAIGQALADVRAGKVGTVPAHLRSSELGRRDHVDTLGYLYPHAHPGGFVRQQYAPDPVLGQAYYQPAGYGAEALARARVAALRHAQGWPQAGDHYDGEHRSDGGQSAHRSPYDTKE